MNDTCQQVFIQQISNKLNVNIYNRNQFFEKAPKKKSDLQNIQNKKLCL